MNLFNLIYNSKKIVTAINDIKTFSYKKNKKYGFFSKLYEKSSR